MKASKRIIAVILTICVFGLFIPTGRLIADDAPTTVYPRTVANYNSRLKDNSYLTTTSIGYMRVYYDGTKVGIENYDSDLNIISTKTVETELSVQGGFYKGNDAYYIVEGENNTAEDDDAEVIRVIKYDFDWNRQGAASITGHPWLFGGEVRYPFDAGNVNFAEYDDTLYIVTGHEGYVDSAVGQGHQGFLMIAVDESTMDGSIVECDLWHSFAQYIRAEGSDLYILEQSDGNRCTQLSLYNADNKDWDGSFSVLDYGGTHTSAWAIACYASVDGLELSDNNVLGIGTSIDQSLYDTVTYDTSHNIYLTVTPKSDMSQEATTVKWLTDYKDDGKTFTNVKLTKINGNRFLVTWGEWDGEIHEATDTNDLFSGYTMHYVFIDENGNKLTQEYTASGLISDCQPIMNGSDVVFFTSNSGTLNFYTIDANSGNFSKKIYRKAGDNATWDMDSDGTLTISGSGVMETEQREYGIGSVSSIGGYSYYTGSVWAPIKSSITTIRINDGITEIGEKAFYRFAYDHNNIDIYIPDSVTSIGEDALWSGWYSWNYEYHIVYMTICCNCGSYAHEYAKENGIAYVLLDIGDVNGDGKITTVDAKWVLQAVSGSRELTPEQEAAADVNGDGKITTVDAKWILQAVSGSRVLDLKM